MSRKSRQPMGPMVVGPFKLEESLSTQLSMTTSISIKGA